MPGGYVNIIIASFQEVPHLAQFANLYPQFRFASHNR